jgi:2-hydroxy-3-keto-5-methylthiopentenyl-1-phosphate phosphatase
MNSSEKRFRALISSDWNECLAPCGPFDAIAFNYPELQQSLQSIFRKYTSNQISLKEAASRIDKLILKSLSKEQMDAYLDQEFKTYKNVGTLIQWCLDNDILFMINTTGMIGYFQRVFAKKLLPVVPVLSAHPLLCFAPLSEEPGMIFELEEISGKAINTQKVIKHYQIAPERVIIMGDSGGDGPHFLWGQSIGACLVGSMTKYSLKRYCKEYDIHIDFKWGISYEKEQLKFLDLEMEIDFLDLVPTIKDCLKI